RNVAEARRPSGGQDQQQCAGAVEEIGEVEDVVEAAVQDHLRRDAHLETAFAFRFLWSGGLQPTGVAFFGGLEAAAPHGNRGRGIGKSLLTKLARIARERGCGRVEWAVLDWNAPSIAFYRSIGAVSLDDWKIMRLTGDALDALAE